MKKIIVIMSIFLMISVLNQKDYKFDDMIKFRIIMIVECPEEEASRVEALLQQEMQGVAELSVPLLAEAHTGRNWLAAKG